MAPETLTAEQVCTIARLCWGSRNDGGSEALADFLGINHRSALRLMAGTMGANPGVTRELISEFRRFLLRSNRDEAAVIRLALEPEADSVG